MFKIKQSLWDENNTGENGIGSGGSDVSKLQSEIESLNEEKQRILAHQQKLLDETKQAKEHLKQAKEQLKQFDGLDAEKIKTMMKAFDSSEEARLLAEGKFDDVINKRLERVNLDYNQKIENLSKQVDSEKEIADKYRSRYDSKMIEISVRSAAEKAGVIPSAIDDVISRSTGIFSIGDGDEIEARDKNGNLRTVGNKPLTPDLFVADLKEKAPHFWPSSQGTGAQGKSQFGVKKNPFDKNGGHYNLTEQAKLMKSNKDLAMKLKQAAEG